MALIGEKDIIKEEKVKVYIVATQTGTWLSQALKIVTKAKYNHISISFDKDLESMYSFGRKNAYNPFFAGLVQESPRWGTFKRFPNTISKIVSLELHSNDYLKMKKYVEDMYSHKDDYHYNLLGVFLGYFNKAYDRDNYYYCSEFVEEVLIVGNLIDNDHFGVVVKPVDILAIEENKLIYEGLLKDYK